MPNCVTEARRPRPGRRPETSLASRFARLRLTSHLALALGFALALGLAAAPGLEASARKAKGFYNEGRKQETAKNYDEALALFEQAQLENPRNHSYELAIRRLRFVAGQAHVDTGRKLRDAGQFEEALGHFQRGLEIDPGSTVAAQQLKRTKTLIEKRNAAEKLGEAPGDIMASAIELDRLERSKMVQSLKGPPVLAPLSNQLIDVTMSQQSKVIFETIGKLAGINVLFDPDFQDKEVEISIQNATLSDALDYVSLLAKTYWKPLSSNAIFVTNDNTNKRRDYEDEIVKTIYLTNVATPQELQEITTAIRGLTDIRRMFPVTSMNAIILRGSASKIALAEKVIHDVDKARPEVIIDVIVIETSRSNTRDLGISPVSSGGPGISIPVTFSPLGSGGEDGGGGLRLGHGVSLNNWVTTLPGLQLTALLSSSDSHVMQSPRIRVADNHQASLRIGDRIPIATGSFQPGIGGVGVNPLVNTQFSYTDVGVNIDITPKIHNDREVSMHIEIEISNVRDFVDIGGISQPVIGQRTIQHDVRLREGEASILGGLNQSTVFKSKSGVPFLSNIPILGHLFSINTLDTQENEVLIILIPHIVRLPEIEESNLRGIASGTDQVFQVRRIATGNGKPALPPTQAEAGTTPTPAPATAPPAETPAVTAQAPTPAAPATEQPAEPAPTPEQPAPAQPAAAQPAAEAPEQTDPASGLRFAFSPSQPTVAVGEQVQLDVLVEQAQQLFGAPLRIRYDREKLRVISIAKGDFLAGEDGTDLIFSRNIRNQVGQAAVNISRFPGTGGADGSGVLISIVFEGLAAGAADVRVIATGARNASSEVVQIPVGRLNVTVE